MFTENLPYIGLSLIACGSILIFIGVFGIAYIKGQEDVKEELGAGLKQGNKQEIFRKILDDSTEQDESDAVYNTLMQPDAVSSKKKHKPAGANSLDKVGQAISQAQAEQEKKQVLEMASQGMSVTQIAKKLNRGKGEIGLIVSLAKRGTPNEE